MPHPRSRGAASASSIGCSRTSAAVRGSFRSAPQYGHFSEAAPGSRRRRLRTRRRGTCGASPGRPAPRLVIPISVQRGGGGGGGAGGSGAEEPANSWNVERGAQPAAPGFHASVPGATWPPTTMPFSASSVYGPYVFPSTVSDQRGAAKAAPAGGGGAMPGAGGAPPCRSRARLPSSRPSRSPRRCRRRLPRRRPGSRRRPSSRPRPGAACTGPGGRRGRPASCAGRSRPRPPRAGRRSR